MIKGSKKSKRKHQCEGCISGECKKHDSVPEYRHISTGSTISTSSDNGFEVMSNFDNWSSSNQESESSE